MMNPRSDREFREFALGSLDSASGDPDHLERLLRAQHPDAIVRPRNLAGEILDVWYVYRDGFWKP